MVTAGAGRPASAIGPWLAFLGQALLAPEAERLSRLLDELDRATGGCHDDPFLGVFRQALAADPVELEKEYVRLFLDPAGAPCPPWQSVWDEEPRLMGPSHERALEWYRAEGVEPAREGEPADHAGLLMLFCARLVGSDRPGARIAQFWQDHLEWIPRLCERIEQETTHPFFRAWARRAASLLGQAPFAPAPNPADKI